MRVAVLWIELNGYLNSCLREIASRPGVEIFVAHRSREANAAFDDRQFAWIERQLLWQQPSDLDALDSLLEDFQPNVIVVCGWMVSAYNRVSKKWKSRCPRIMTMDNYWLGTPRQWLACATSRFTVHRMADAVWVPGDRQVTFARKLGFSQARILRANLSGDFSRFSAIYSARVKNNRPLPKAFLFVGRLIELKGIRTLIDAYRFYRQRTKNPWPLLCIGRGSFASSLKAEPGVTVEDFVQPEHLPARMAHAACLVLPTPFEKWGLVVHEAAAAGLIILASEAVGAVAHLVQNNYNGFVFEVNNAEGLAQLMERVSGFSDEKLEAMSAASSSLARQFTPQRWADTLLEFAEYSGRHAHA